MSLLENIPLINTCLNVTSLAFMGTGYIAGKGKALTTHKVLMSCAVVSSALFLSGYLYYHFAMEAKTYTGAYGGVYYPILASHVILAMTVPFLLAYVIYKGYTNQLIDHRRVGRRALVIWAYVSFTGVVVYLFVHT